MKEHGKKMKINGFVILNGSCRRIKILEKNKEGMYYLPYHKYKGNTLRSFLAIETRLREFANLNSNN